MSLSRLFKSSKVILIYWNTVSMWSLQQPTFFPFFSSNRQFRYSQIKLRPLKEIFLTIERLIDFTALVVAALKLETSIGKVPLLVLVLTYCGEGSDTLSILQSSSFRKCASFLFVLIAASTSSRSTIPITVTFWFAKSASIEYSPFIWERAFRIFL